LIKVLDFGLGKILSDESAHDPSATTCEWTISGTPAYMSPEQARGGAVDGATDIWAFGCVLFEMLTGVSAFDGATAADVSAAILRGEPWSAVFAPGTPPWLRELVKCGLESNPKNRLRHIRDARLFLESAMTESGLSDADVIRSSPPRPAWLWPVALLGLTAVGLLGGFAAARWLSPVKPQSAIRLPTAPPFRLKPRVGSGPSVAESPDGRPVGYALQPGATTL